MLEQGGEQLFRLCGLAGHWSPPELTDWLIRGAGPGVKGPAERELEKPVASRQRLCGGHQPSKYKAPALLTGRRSGNHRPVSAWGAPLRLRFPHL